MRETIRFRLNGRPTTLETEGDRSLLWVLRTDLGLTGAKFGCGITACGACTVLVDGRPVRSCRYPLARVQDADVTTVEGLARDGELHPLQEEFARRGALQCGYCTSGMILQAYALLSDNPSPTRAEIVRGMDRNLCRCGAHARILDAVEAAAARTRRTP